MLLLAACNGSGGKWSPPLHEIVPAAEGRAWVFDVGGGACADLDPVAAPATAGALRASGKDQSTGYAAVLYQGALAIVDLYNEDVTWSNMSLPAGRATLAMGDRLAGLVAGSTGGIVTIPGGEMAWKKDLGPWLGDFDLDRADYLMPVSEDTFVLVASRAPSAFGSSRIVAQKIDRSSGSWRLLGGEGDIPAISRLGACTNVGGTLYVAGIHERVAPGTGTKAGTMQQILRVYRYDPETGDSRMVVEEAQFDRRTEVIDIAAGRDPATKADLVSVLNGTGTLKVYEVPPSGRTSSAKFTDNYAGATSTAWVSPTRVAVEVSGALQYFDVRR